MNQSVNVLNANIAHHHVEKDTVDNNIKMGFLKVQQDERALEVLYKIKHSNSDDNLLSLVFIENINGEYLGFVRLSALVRAKSGAQVNTMVEGEKLWVYHDEDHEAAARLLQKNDLPLLPVLHRETGRLCGVLTFDDAMDILEQETSEDMYWKAGVGDLLHQKDTIRSEKLTQGPIGYTLKVRVAFLMVTLIGGMLVGGLIDHFEDVLGAILALAIFIPLVMDMGGNVGTQSSTIFARGLALGHIKMEGFFKNHLLREMKVGLSMGVLIAILAGCIAHFWQGVPNDLPMLGFVVGTALLVSVTTASILGFLLPWIMIKVGVDHAPGADPFITTIKDFSGLMVYFLMAGWLLGVAG